ncbi:hypothetical protein CEW83_20450 [Parazoarcus communis]|uniref:DUF2189 domain-containing protein n=1 Tax=Parazoarcus communis TaxID=41977 RepID=A0A2U8GVL4_9RHOO|nr:DUF2189 domain-containing protein [Parazoarcus communis]AWI77313.1 hypothetical protein CEW83_20450 [Parazoarcus communis]
MAKTFHTLDQHFHLPHVREIKADRPFRWLALGLSDMRDNLAASLTYGVFFAVAGYLILSYAANMPYLFTAAICGFFLVGPLAAAGLYEISRRHAAGQTASFSDSLAGLRKHREGLMYFGAFFAIALIGWERISAILFALLYQGGAPDLSNFYRDVFLSGDYTHFVVAYLVIGGILAAVVFSLSVISIPMTMDRDTDGITAAMTSMRAVGVNLGAMAVWAALIVALVGIGFATMMIGMVVVLPLLGHASWHAYREMIE